MSVAGTEAITELWAKAKAWFGRSLGASTTATTVSIHLKNNAGDNLGNAATIGAASGTAAGAMTADMYNKLDSIEAGAQVNDVTGVKGSSESTYRTGNVSLSAANVGAAASSHAHGSITNAGAITSDTAAASGDKLVIADSSDSSKLKRSGIALGTSATQFLANNGTWQTPAGTTYDDFVGATSSAAGTHGLVPAPAANDNKDSLFGDGQWMRIEAGVVRGNGTTTNTRIRLFRTDGSVSETLGTEAILYEANDTNNGLMSVSDKTKLDGIETGANAYTHPAYTAANAAAVKVGRDATGHVVLGNALTASDVGASATGHKHAAGDITSGMLPIGRGGTGASDASGARTNLDVYSKSEVDNLITGGVTFQGIVNAQSTIEAASYKAGQYWVVGTAGTYVGESCEVGDMVYAIKTKGSAYAASDFSVVQNNLVEMTAAEVDAICV